MYILRFFDWTDFLCNFTAFNSRRAEKYFKRGARLDWPEGAASQESLRAVWKLPRLQVNRKFQTVIYLTTMSDLCLKKRTPFSGH